MNMQRISKAMHQKEAELKQRPSAGLKAEGAATACWNGGTRVLTRHQNGTMVATEMSPDYGGSGEGVTPGWLLRAGLASCITTCIVLAAAVAEVELTELEVSALASTDACGMFGLRDATGCKVGAGPKEIELHVRVAAEGIDQERLLALIGNAARYSPMVNALQHCVPVSLSIEAAVSA